MRTVKTVLILVLSFALVTAVVQNTAVVEARFLWMTTETPVVILLFLTSVGGFALGLLVSLLIQRNGAGDGGRRGGGGKGSGRGAKQPGKG
ncbi:MAG: DUF1049 domain-containing protein [Gemmatimonadales bacterium]|nr:MAG: DUF1049 domain-containing protein [Gemmatimonadales bacterium]